MMILLIAALMLYAFACGMIFTLWAQEHDVPVWIAGILTIYAMVFTACLVVAGIFFLLQFGH